jgi:5-methylcytosine-specific restriction protein B
MTDFTPQYTLWDEFIKVWPKDRLVTMTLDEYSCAGSKDTFTYWIESRLEDLGSIWGGSSFKFGVFSRKDIEDKENDVKLSYSATHGWYSGLGATAEEAFEKVRAYVSKVADLACKGDLEGIEALKDLGEAYKWKIAFHYQDRKSINIVDIFKKSALGVFCKSLSTKASMAELQRGAIAQKSEELGVLEFGQKIWGEWSEKNLPIWKMSHGDSSFSNDERDQLLVSKQIAIYGDTAPDQGKNFSLAPVGTMFYLCHGNCPKLVGQLTSVATPSSKGDGWVQRSYRVIRLAIRSDSYQVNAKKWTPRGNSTFWKVPSDNLAEFEKTLLQPFFNVSLAEIASLAGDTYTSALSNDTVIKHFSFYPYFNEKYPLLDETKKNQFIRLAEVIHDLGLDWLFINSGEGRLRFGCKEKGKRAKIIFGRLDFTSDGFKVRFAQIDDIPVQVSTNVTELVVEEYKETYLKYQKNSPGNDLSMSPRVGYWPDDYIGEQADTENDVNIVDDEQEISININRLAFNRIYYGPPGTGKTFQLQEILEKEYTQKAGSLSPTEWAKQQSIKLTADLTWWEVLAVALYDLNGKADVNALKNHALVKAFCATKQSVKNINQTIWGCLQRHSPENSTTVNVRNKSAPYIFDKTENSIWSLVGDWEDQISDLILKVKEINQGSAVNSESVRRYVFTTFHQSFGYEEFVEGLRPVLEDGASDVEYEIRPGAFLRLCTLAKQDPNHQYAMVIDEINRGNVSKIFGELISLIEIDKREGAKYPIFVTLPYSGKQFSVPANVDIIGTMNTADRSLALVDTALRRRFDFVEVMPDVRDEEGAPLAHLTVSHDGEEINIPQLLATINRRIESLYDREHTIGHAYFTSLNDVPPVGRFELLQAIFKNKVIPLLEEYFFEDWQKIRLVLGDNQNFKKSDKNLQFIQEDSGKDDLSSLFGSNHGLEQYAIRPRYRFNALALTLAKSYVGIYCAAIPSGSVE